MFTEKDMQKMFFAGMEWERRKIQPCSLKEIIAVSISKIRETEPANEADSPIQNGIPEHEHWFWPNKHGGSSCLICNIRSS